MAEKESAKDEGKAGRGGKKKGGAGRELVDFKLI